MVLLLALRALSFDSQLIKACGHSVLFIFNAYVILCPYPFHSISPKPKPMKQNIRRGLAFSSTPGAMCQRSDCVSSDEVETLPDMSHYTEFTIEYRAKHEETLAPLDHYTIHARAASTPFTGKQDRSPARYIIIVFCIILIIFFVALVAAVYCSLSIHSFIEKALSLHYIDL